MQVSFLAMWTGCRRRGRNGLWSLCLSTWQGSHNEGYAPDTHTAADCNSEHDNEHIGGELKKYWQDFIWQIAKKILGRD